MTDNETPNRSANRSKTTGERWTIGRGEDTPRRYDKDVDDDAKPSGDPSLKPL